MQPLPHVFDVFPLIVIDRRRQHVTFLCCLAGVFFLGSHWFFLSCHLSALSPIAPVRSTDSAYSFLFPIRLRGPIVLGNRTDCGRDRRILRTTRLSSYGHLFYSLAHVNYGDLHPRWIVFGQLIPSPCYCIVCGQQDVSVLLSVYLLESPKFSILSILSILHSLSPKSN